jgi:hypothetical protein
MEKAQNPMKPARFDGMSVKIDSEVRSSTVRRSAITAANRPTSKMNASIPCELRNLARSSSDCTAYSEKDILDLTRKTVPSG